MIVKICGITSMDDAIAAVDSGADVLGYNFFEGSSRYIPRVKCAEIQAYLDERGLSVHTAGIFVNEDPFIVRRIMDDCRLDIAQISGDETPEYLDQIPGLIYRSVRLRDPGQVYHVVTDYAGRPNLTLLIDSYRPGRYGGTGETADWSLAEQISRDYPILLAGGLTPDNVSTAIRAVRPWGVDVASGVETAPGVKDHDKMRAFIVRARSAVNETVHWRSNQLE
ncbi:MAG: phosphoribosylanthranilate isomerase [Anaerolineales bacterium]|nr:phosphoribosylanthranilate isomerase [Anaerolineales bacterium]